MSKDRLRYNRQIGQEIFDIFSNRGWAFYNYSQMDQLAGRAASMDDVKQTMTKIAQAGPLNGLKREVIQGVLPICDEPDNILVINEALHRLGASCPTISPPYDLVLEAIKIRGRSSAGGVEKENIAMAYEGGKPFPFAALRPHYDEIEVLERNHRVALVIEYAKFMRVIETLSDARPSRQVL